MEGTRHLPVMYGRTLEELKLSPGMTVVDGTLGGGGHAQGALERISPGGTLIGIDKDVAAIERCKERLKAYGGSVVFVRDDFKNIKAVLSGHGIEHIDAALLDLGVSSFQLDEEERGFSYHKDAALDMRMDRSQALSAREVVNAYTAEELARIIADYGEERWAKRIAQFIVEERKSGDIGTASELVSVIKKAVPKGARSDGPHPARRTFQALRIHVNGELGGLGEAIEDYAGALKSGGRLAVISFHSLEDRIVKRTFQKLADPCECPKDFPHCVCGKTPSVKIVNRRPYVPDGEEIENNARARSAKLRVLEKL